MSIHARVSTMSRNVACTFAILGFSLAAAADPCGLLFANRSKTSKIESLLKTQSSVVISLNVDSDVAGMVMRAIVDFYGHPNLFPGNIHKVERHDFAFDGRRKSMLTFLVEGEKAEKLFRQLRTFENVNLNTAIQARAQSTGNLGPHLINLARSHSPEQYGHIVINQVTFLLKERVAEAEAAVFSEDDLLGLVRHAKFEDRFIFTMTLKRVLELAKSRNFELIEI